MGHEFHALVVDDNRQDRFLIVRELKQQFPECRVTEIADEGQLEQAIAAGGFDLVTTDYQLRWSDGLAVLRAVKFRCPNQGRRTKSGRKGRANTNFRKGL